MEDFDDFSCFALTELGHGSNVRGILTTATYDKEDKEFIINSPNNMAMKFWIGGAGKSANVCCCWAQLIVDGVDMGPHAFVVPLRDRKTHIPLNGVTVGDCGMKEGHEGIDNGFILFDNVRIPKDNFLNRLSDISDDGVFTSPIKSADQRFALSLGGLSVGRILLIGNMQL
jgi:acyl-CoA oxidase